MKSSSASAAPAAGDGSGIRAHVDASAFRLAEVWGDTVDLRHLAWSVALGVAVSVAAFEAARLCCRPLSATRPSCVRTQC